MKGALIPAAFFAAFALFTSCDTRSSDGTKEVAEEKNEERFDDNEKQEDAQFLVNATELNMEVIELSRLAQEKGTTMELKEMAKKLEDAHTNSLSELRALSQTKTISIPTARTQNALASYNDLDKESGEGFDKSYADKAVRSHEDAISAYEDAIKESSDLEIKKWATAALPELRQHLEQLKNFQEKYATTYLDDKNNNNNNNVNHRNKPQ